MNTVTIIAHEVSRVTGISINDILSERRELPIVNARHMAIVLTKEFTPFGSSKVARAWKRADHTSILYAYKAWPDRAKRLGLSGQTEQARTAIKSALMGRRLTKYIAANI